MPYEYTLPEGYADEEITGVIAESIASHRDLHSGVWLPMRNAVQPLNSAMG